MATLTEADDWASGIYQIEEGDPVLGGPTGLTNTPPRQLANRTLYQRLRNVTPWDAALLYPAMAYVQYAGKTYRSAAININVVPGTDATKWVRWGFTIAELNSELTTPPQFDATTKIATMAAVQRALGNYQGQYAISANTVLTAAQAGSVINVGGSFSVSLPAAGSCAVGARFQINNSAAGSTAIVQASAGDNLFSVGNSTARSFSLGAGDSITVAYMGAGSWYAWGGAQLGLSAAFASSALANGYQKLPSGVIVQRGSFSASAAADIPVTFPIAFPNAIRQIITTAQVTTTGIFGGYNLPTLTGFNGNAWVSSSTRANATVDYVAFGN